VKAYAGVCDAMKLPRETEEEKDARVHMIEESGERTAEIAKNNGYLCKRVHKIGLILRSNSSANTATDLEVGLSLAQVGIDGAVGCIKSSLHLIKDEEKKSSLKKDIEELTKSENYYENLYDRSHH
jgi:formiminotetrahydrofolate cyclodeaminase